MYNVGWFPAIVPGEKKIIGELYEVSINDMPSIDALEGEGSLYMRRCETASGEIAYLYEYLEDNSGLERISSWKDYVWYVSYGSNMLYERSHGRTTSGTYPMEAICFTRDSSLT